MLISCFASNLHVDVSPIRDRKRSFLGSWESPKNEKDLSFAVTAPLKKGGSPKMKKKTSTEVLMVRKVSTRG
jgi:hypothetical protein